MRGSGHTNARLTEQNVREIRALLQVPGTTQREIAERYGVSRHNVTAIKAGRTWVHVQN